VPGFAIQQRPGRRHVADIADHRLDRRLIVAQVVALTRGERDGLGPDLQDLAAPFGGR
jgi:hypothetical protein